MKETVTPNWIHLQNVSWYFTKNSPYFKMYRNEVANLNEVHNTLPVTLRQHAFCNYDRITEISPHQIQHRHDTLGRHMYNAFISIKPLSIFKSLEFFF